jgi:hypothetical protein
LGGGDVPGELFRAPSPPVGSGRRKQVLGVAASFASVSRRRASARKASLTTARLYA